MITVNDLPPRYVQLIEVLIDLRLHARLKQQDIADRIHCTQSKVSKMEVGDDMRLCFGDLAKYAEALGYDLHISLVSKKH